MRVLDGGNVQLGSDEVKALAEALDLGQQLVEQLGVGERGAREYTVEARLYRQLERLKHLGVSVDNLADAVDSRLRNV